MSHLMIPLYVTWKHYLQTSVFRHPSSKAIETLLTEWPKSFSATLQVQPWKMAKNWMNLCSRRRFLQCRRFAFLLGEVLQWRGLLHLSPKLPALCMTRISRTYCVFQWNRSPQTLQGRQYARRQYGIVPLSIRVSFSFTLPRKFAVETWSLCWQMYLYFQKLHMFSLYLKVSEVYTPSSSQILQLPSPIASMYGILPLEVKDH